MVKIRMPGPAAGYGWQRTIESWAPGQVVELPDDNEQAVTWGRAWLGMGAELVTDAPPPPPPEPTLADLRAEAEAKGLPTYGTKADLSERIGRTSRKETI